MIFSYYEKYETKNQIKLKLVRNLFVFKLFNLYI